jgi:hypothetical protein
VLIRYLQAKKSPELDRFPDEFLSDFNEKLIPVLLKLFHKIEK